MDKENARQIRLSILGTNDDFGEWIVKKLKQEI